LVFFEQLDQDRTENKADQERGYSCQGRPNRNIAEDIEEEEIFSERHQKPVQQSRPP
jgi:hypothetical protein